MLIAKFITENMEAILAEWETFASTFGVVVEDMSSIDLRDHAKQILEFVAADIQSPESAHERHQKGKGLGQGQDGEHGASAVHGRLRYASGFTLVQLLAEYRALRASVLRLWEHHRPDTSAAGAEADDIIRFNEAIDQSLAEAAVAYSEKVNETRDTFLAILGHDLRGPLASTATAGTYLTRPGAFDDRLVQIGVRIKRSAATMSGMINDLLELARSNLGDGIPIVRQECDLLEMCQWAIEDANAAHPHARFVLNASGDLQGDFDQARLQQVLTNLASNAAQYGEREKSIVVTATGERDFIQIEVRNQGSAIPADELSGIFSSFVQLPARQQDARARSSLGLGLYIAKQIVVAHGGSIDVQSDDLAGTAFIFKVPR